MVFPTENVECGGLADKLDGAVVAGHPSRALNEDSHWEEIDKRQNANPAIEIQPIHLLEVLQALLGVYWASVAKERGEDDGEDGLGGFDDVGKGDNNLGEGDAGGDVADGVEEGGAEEGKNEVFGDGGTRLELRGPEEEHPNGVGEELEGGKKSWEGEDVEGLLVVDVEDDVLEVPEAEDEG
ncbi:hypothetical protein ACLOJK_018380 [Asimina triloba]